jgi:hypothetical protein
MTPRSPIACLVLSLFSLLLACSSSSTLPQPRSDSPRLAFWRDVRARNGALSGTDAPHVAELAVELATTLLRSEDPELRDGVATDVLEFWIRRDRTLDVAGLRVLTDRLYEGLRVGIGRAGDDSVYGRSFSALILSMVASRDAKEPFLTDRELTTMVTTAAWYAGAEVDLRGHDARGGWAHAAAHTADWLRALGAHGALGPARSKTVLDAVTALTVRRHGMIFAYGEDGRLAQSVLAVLALRGVSDDLFAAWLADIAAPLMEPAGKQFDPGLFAAQRNSRNLLFTLFVQLSMLKEPNPTESAALTSLKALLAD